MHVPSAVTANHPPLDIYNNVDFLQEFSAINNSHSPKETLNQTKGYQMKRQAITPLHYAAQAPNEESRKFTIKIFFPDFQSSSHLKASYITLEFLSKLFLEFPLFLYSITLSLCLSLGV